MAPRSVAADGAALGASPTTTVVVCAYTAGRWQLLTRALESLDRQSRRPVEVVLVIDHDDELLRRARAAFRGARVVASRGPRGLSGARNTGVEMARGEVVAFLDDDASAHPDWLERLTRHYADPAVLAVGGQVRAAWACGRPAWFPPEFDWVVGCSYLGQPRALAEVRNPIGAGMSFRRNLFGEVGGFDAAVGRVGTLPLGCEETELAIRARRRFPEGRILYDPDAVVDHAVPPARATLRYFVARCWSEGVSKAAVARLAGADAALASERGYVARTLTRGVVRELGPIWGGRGSRRPARAAAICAGLLTTTAGFSRALLTFHHPATT